MKKILAFLLALSVILAFVGCGDKQTISTPSDDAATSDVEFKKPDNYASVVLVTINPEVRLYLDENDKVLAVEPVNADAKTITKELELEGKEFKNVVKEIVTSANQNGFIKKDAEVNFKVEEVKSDKVNSTELLNTAKETTNTIVIELKIEVEIKSEDKTHTHTFSDATCTKAAKCECGEVSGEALGHNYVDGKCSRCKAEDPNVKYTSVKTKSGGWFFMFVANDTLHDARLVLSGSEIYASAGLGDNIKNFDGVMLPEELEDCVKFNGETYRVARGTGPVPLKSVTEDGKKITATDENGNSLVLTRTGETTLKVTSSPDVFSEYDGKIPVGTVLTFKTLTN